MRARWLILVVVGCAPHRPMPPTAPQAGWADDATTVCRQYGGQSERGAACIKWRESRHYGRVWSRHGPFEATMNGIHARGWYHEDRRDGGWTFSDGAVVRAEGQYSHGGRVGPWTVRYAGGQVASETVWSRRGRQGKARFFYPDGSPWWQGRYEDSVPVGTWSHWDRDGVRRDVDPAHEPVGPLAAPPGFNPLDDNECAYSLADLASVGEIVDENGELVARPAEDEYDVDCRDEGGRRVLTKSWFDTTYYREVQ